MAEDEVKSKEMVLPKAVPILTGGEATPQHFRASVHPERKPAVLRGLDFGPCVDKWKDAEYLASKDADKSGVVHSSYEPVLDFRRKNFEYATLPWPEIVRRAADRRADQPYLYLRALGESEDGGRKPRQMPADLARDWPELAADFKLPEGLFEPSQFFSSVLRLSTPEVALWAHYDVMDNLYVQVAGSKRFLLWPPSDADKLYLDGDKSAIPDVSAPDLSRYPLFALASGLEVTVEAGDCLFIPAYWFHATKALDFGAAINVFWRQVPSPHYFDPKDVYGNRPPLPAARASRALNTAIGQLEQMPLEERTFYARGFISQMEDKIKQWSQLSSSK